MAKRSQRMARQEFGSDVVPMKGPVARDGRAEHEGRGMTHDDLVAALRDIRGLLDVAHDDSPNFQFRSRPFLHFHQAPQGVYADVRFGGDDFEPVWASTPEERQRLLARVRRHVERVDRGRKADRGATRPGRHR
jgi:hypothetical protein